MANAQKFILALFVFATVAWGQSNASGGNSQGNGSGNATYCADASGSGVTYTCPTPVPVVNSLNGLFVTFVPQTTSSSAPATLNVAGQGAKTLKQADGATNVAAGALIGGQAYFFTFNGTNFVQTNSGINTSTQLSDTANIVYTNQARTMAALLSVPGGDLFMGGINAQIGTSYTYATTDDNKLTSFSNAAAIAVTLPQATTAGFGSGFFNFTFNKGAGLVTITPTTSQINGAASLTLAQNQGALIVSDGSNYTAWFSPTPSSASAATTVSVTFSATPAFNCPSVSQGTAVYFTLSTTMTANITGTFATCTPGSTVVIKFVQDVTGGRTAAITNADAFLIHPAPNIQTMCVFTVEDATHLRSDGCISNAGYSATSTVAAPGTPPAGVCFGWFDSTDNRFHDKCNNTTTIGTTIVAASAPASQFANAFATNGVITFAQPLVSGLGGATASNTVANGNNPQTWNCAPTTDAQDCMTFGETSAATNGTLTSGLANQALFHLNTLSGSTETPFEIDQVAVTGATGPPAAQIEFTWNNASLVGKGLVISGTNTASAVGSKPLQTLIGGVEQFSADKSGNVVAATSLQTTNTAPAITAGTGGAIGMSEGTAATGLANVDVCYGDSTAHAVKCSYNNGTFFQMPQVIASGTATMTTAAIGAGACGTTVTVSATGVLTTDTITVAFNAAPAGTNAGLTQWPTANNVNFAYCPGVAETPAAATVNWRVMR